MATREDYGIDAPTVVRNLALGGAVLLVAQLLPLAMPGAAVVKALWPTGVAMLATAGWMLVSSLWLKRRVMRLLLALHRWRGDEAVLDIGCGRGLVAVEAARRVPRGRVCGIDLWQRSDLSGNGPAAIRANAAYAGVAARLTVDTGDARALPYEAASFDVVTSMTVIHNIPGRAGRRAAIAEAWRVLKPGGRVLIFDIMHARRYRRQLLEAGAVDVRLRGPIPLWGPLGWSVAATKPG